MKDTEEIKQLIGRAKLEQALERLETVVPEEYKSNVTVLSSQLKGLKIKKILSILSNSEETAEHNKITVSTLNLIGLIEKEEKEKVAKTKIANKVSIIPVIENGKENLEVLYLTACPYPKERYSKINSGDEVELVNSEDAGIDIEFKPIKKNARLSDLIDYWEEYTPRIIHFSMHGDEGDYEENIPEGLAFEKEGKQANIVSFEKLKETFEDLHGNYPIEFTVFNACYSSEAAKEVSKLGIHAIGCNNELKESAAHAFTKKFYRMYSKTKDIVKSTRSGIRAAKEKDEIARHIHLYYNGQKIEL